MEHNMDARARAELRVLMSNLIAIDQFHEKLKTAWRPRIPVESTIDVAAIKKAKAEQKRERRAAKRNAL
jgi:hypothetical protein